MASDMESGIIIYTEDSFRRVCLMDYVIIFGFIINDLI